MSNQMQAEIASLNVQLDESGDTRECWMLLQQKIDQMKAAGWAIPEDLRLLERQLMAECLAESQGR
jgi:hypothetical protein